MNPLEHIYQKFGISMNGNMPIQLEMTRTELAGMFYSFGYKVGAEIGVERGDYSNELCLSNPDLLLYCIDPWKIDTYQHINASQYTQEMLDHYYSETKRKLSPFNCKIYREESLRAVNRFKKDSLDFIYIDANHSFECVVNDIISWYKIIRPGGIISGHDYVLDNIDNVMFHVKFAVDAYTQAYKIKPWFILTGDGTPSWFWVKQ